MADPLEVPHRALQTYLATVALLGLATLAWSATNLLVLDDVTLASIWFGVAGAGTVLVAVFLYRHAYVDVAGVDPEPEAGIRTP